MYLLIGGDSKIGLALANFWTKNKYEFHTTTRRYTNVTPKSIYFDLTRPSDLQLTSYDSVILCAGVSSIRKCAEDPQYTQNVNVVCTKNLVQSVIASDCYFLFLSTTQVFDGQKCFRATGDQPNPKTEYGRQKREIEEFLVGCSNCGILRLTKIEDEDNDLLQRWKKQIEQGRSIEAFYDVYLSPIEIELVVQRITSMMIEKSCGIVHLGGKEEISYYEYACRQVVRWGYSENLVTQVPCSASNQKLPRYSSLK